MNTIISKIDTAMVGANGTRKSIRPIGKARRKYPLLCVMADLKHR